VPEATCDEIFESRGIALVQLVNSPKSRAKLLPRECDRLITTVYHQIRDSSLGLLLVRTVE
jgi:hypothetical protein